MELNEFKQQNGNENEESVIVNPNLKPDVDNLQKVDPAKMLNLKSPQEIADEKRPGTEFTDILNDGIDVIKKRADEAEEFADIMEQTEEEKLSGEDIASVKGFDPFEMMKTPPVLNKAQIRAQVEAGTYGAEEPAEVPTPKPEEKVAVEPKESNDEKTEPSLEDEILNEMEENENMGDVSPFIANSEPAEMYQPVKSTTTETAQKVELSAVLDSSSKEAETPDDDFEAEILKELEESEHDEDDSLQDDRMQALKDQIKSKISPIATPFNLKTFTISSKPTTVKNTVKQAQVKHAKVADWALPATKLHVTMEGFLGEDITTLASRSARNTAQGIRDQYKIFYDHILDKNKPDSLDAWLKIVNVADIDHLYAAAYRATFEGMNFIPYECTNDKCAKSFLSDSLPFMDLVKFKDDETKKSFMELLNSETTESAGEYVSELIQISETYAVTIKSPSIYDVVIRPSYLDGDFRQKYDRAMPITPYIDNVYYIDTADSSLRPIKFMEYTGNPAKTEKARVIVMDKIIKTLTADQYFLLASYISNMNEKNDGVTYVMPETVCPFCGEVIKEENYSAMNLLFLRHQLAALANG